MVAEADTDLERRGSSQKEVVRAAVSERRETPSLIRKERVTVEKL